MIGSLRITAAPIIAALIANRVRRLSEAIFLLELRKRVNVARHRTGIVKPKRGTRMRKSVVSSVVFAAAALCASPGFAESDVACNYGTPEAWDSISLLFAGPWKIAHHAGYVIAGVMTIPFPASGDIETMQIEILADGQMIGTHPEAQNPITFIWADEPPWSFDADAREDGVPRPLLSSSDIETIMQCGVEDLARLIGHTQVTIDGMVMDMTVRLMVTGANQMYGIFHTSSIANGVPVNSWRAVTMTR